MKRFESLMEENQELILKQREIYKKYIQSQILNIDFRNDFSLKTEIYLAAIPPHIVDKLEPLSLAQLSTTKKIRQKSQFMALEFLKLLSEERMTREENLELVKWIAKLLSTNSSFLSLSMENELRLTNLKQSDNPTAQNANKFIVAAGQFIEQCLTQLMEDSLTGKLPIYQSAPSIKILIFSNLKSLFTDPHTNQQLISWKPSSLEHTTWLLSAIRLKEHQMRHLSQEIDPSLKIMLQTCFRRLQEFQDLLVSPHLVDRNQELAE